jgi:ABC-type Fe3+/spermidine/putrescine transport system ATPase subunit
MVFQKLALFPHMTVAQNIGFPLKLRKVDPQAIATQVDEMIRLMELKPEYLKRYPKALSGGEQQRVALARSMISSPKLLLLDEPLSALDVKLKKVLQAELKRLHRSVGVTFVHVTHDLEEAMMLADRICVMRAGKILQLGEPADIYYRPADPFVAGFIGETNLIPITISGRNGDSVAYTNSEITDANGSLPASLVAEELGQGPALMNVRPELIRRCDRQANVDCKLPATVTELFTKGGTVQYRARTPQGRELAIEIQGTSHLPMQLGEDVWLGWAKKDIWVLKPGEA